MWADGLCEIFFNYVMNLVGNKPFYIPNPDDTIFKHTK